MKKFILPAAVVFVCLSGTRLPAQETNAKEDFSAVIQEQRNFNRSLSMIPNKSDYKTPEGIAAQRKMMAGFSGGKTVIVPQVKMIKGPAGDIALRIFSPDTIRAVMLDIHGGAWIVGSASSDDQMNDAIARNCHVAVVSVDYRLAPENPFPACIADCRAAAAWLVKNAKELFHTENIMLGGASAGAHLAALTTLYIRDSLHAIDKVIGVNLEYGAYDLSMSPSMRQVTDSTLILPKKDITEIFSLLFGKYSMDELKNPLLSPLYANLKGLPPALFVIGTADPLLDDNLFMEARWRMAGNKTFLSIYPEGTHGVNLFPTKMGKMASQDIINWIKNIANK